MVGGTVSHHFLNAKSAFLSEKLVLSLHYLQDTLEHGHFTGNSENPSLLKPKLFLSFSEQHVKGLVTQILGWYNEPAKVHANTNSNVALGNHTARSSSLTFRQRKCSFQKLDASAGVGVTVVVVTSSCFWRICHPSPFLKNLLKPHYVSDLVRFLRRIHGHVETLVTGFGLLFQLAIIMRRVRATTWDNRIEPGFLFGWVWLIIWLQFIEDCCFHNPKYKKVKFWQQGILYW